MCVRTKSFLERIVCTRTRTNDLVFITWLNFSLYDESTPLALVNEKKYIELIELTELYSWKSIEDGFRNNAVRRLAFKLALHFITDVFRSQRLIFNLFSVHFRNYAIWRLVFKEKKEKRKKRNRSKYFPLFFGYVSVEMLNQLKCIIL